MKVVRMAIGLEVSDTNTEDEGDEQIKYHFKYADPDDDEQLQDLVKITQLL